MEEKIMKKLFSKIKNEAVDTFKGCFSSMKNNKILTSVFIVLIPLNLISSVPDAGILNLIKSSLYGYMFPFVALMLFHFINNNNKSILQKNKLDEAENFKSKNMEENENKVERRKFKRSSDIMNEKLQERIKEHE